MGQSCGWGEWDAWGDETSGAGEAIAMETLTHTLNPLEDCAFIMLANSKFQFGKDKQQQQQQQQQ